MKQIRRLFCTLMLCLIGYAAIAYPSTAFAKDKKDALSEKEEKIQKRIKAIKRLDTRISKLDKEIIAFEQDLQKTEDHLSSLEIKEANARKELEDELARLSLLSREIVRMERMPTEVMSLFSEETLKDTQKRQGIIAQSRKSLAHAIEKQKKAVYAIQEIRIEKETAATELLQKQSALSTHRQKLQKLFDQQVRWLKSDDAESAKLLQSARNKAKKAANLNELAALIDQTKSKHITLAPRYAEKLPVTGHVIQHYGDKNTVGVKARGMTIETTLSEPVKALSDGRIIYSDDFREYGHIIILEHPSGIHSVYSGLGKSSLTVGDYVRAGGILGNMPHEQSPKLYLELRRNGATLDPYKWIKRQKS